MGGLGGLKGGMGVKSVCMVIDALKGLWNVGAAFETQF